MSDEIEPDDGACLANTWKSKDTDSDNESHKEHLRLADIVKGVHADLRNKYKKCAGNVCVLWTLLR